MSLSELVKDKKLDQESKRRLVASIQRRLLEENLVDASTFSEKGEEIKRKIYSKVQVYLESECPSLPVTLREEIAGDVFNRIFGLGPIESLLKDPEVTDILIQDTHVLIVRNGRKEEMGEVFLNLEEVKKVIDRIVSYRGKKVDMLTPSLDIDLYDGSRCHIIIPPASDRIYLSIRKHTCANRTLDELIQQGMLSSDDAFLLQKAIRTERKNVLVSGSTGAGKTTLINSLAKLIPENHIVVVIEDTPELSLPQPYRRYLRTREKSTEGAEAITQAQLLIYSLRMNPDRIILGEVRDPLAAYELIHVLNTGHSGSLSTIHADSAADALWRLENLALEYSRGLNLVAIRRQIARVINLIVHIKAVEDEAGNIVRRKITEILEVKRTLDSNAQYQFKNLKVEKC